MRRTLLPAALLLLVGAGPGVAQDLPFVLDTLQVSVDSRLAPGSGAVQILDARVLESLPVRTVQEALRWGLGLDLQERSPAQADLSIRGSTFEQVLVLVDGVRMSDPQTGHFDLDLVVPLERVARIEILRGPASALYGADALGGVVNVVTRDGRGVETTSGATRLEGGTHDTWSAALDATVPVGRWHLVSGVSTGASDGHREGTDYRMTQGTVRLSGPAGAGRAVLDLGHARRDFGATEFYAPYDSYEETRTTAATARWVGLASDVLTLSPRISYRRHEDDFALQREDPDFYRNLHDSRQVTGELQARLPLGSTGALALGGEWTRESLESTNLGDRDQDVRAVYAEAAFGREGVQFQVGLRHDRRDDVGNFNSPSASVRWDGGPWGFRASWGRTFRAPTWTERYYEDPANVGTPDLAAERGWSAEVGGEFRHVRGVLEARVFRRFTENLIDWARPNGAGDTIPWETRNVEQATVEGVELELSGVRYRTLEVWASAAWLALESREADGYFSKYALRPIHRELLVRGRLLLPDDSWLQSAAAHRARLGGGGGLTLDLRLDVPLGESRLYLDVLNATDEAYPDVTGLPIPGRAFLVGARTPFGG